ncbi:MAG: hypothetical protein ACTSVY_16450, partial [Candidatus Helarchaeota archaeon]
KVRKKPMLKKTQLKEPTLSDFSQTVITWLEYMKQKFTLPKEIIEYVDDLEVLLKIKTNENFQEELLVAS